MFVRHSGAPFYSMVYHHPPLQFMVVNWGQTVHHLLKTFQARSMDASRRAILDCLVPRAKVSWDTCSFPCLPMPDLKVQVGDLSDPNG